MSGGQIAALIAAGAFVVLVLVLSIQLFKLGRTLDEATLAIRKAHEGADPLLRGAADTMRHVNSNLVKVDDITTNAASVTTNAAALTSVVASTVGGPLVKVAAFTYGVRRAVSTKGKKG